MCPAKMQCLTAAQMSDAFAAVIAYCRDFELDLCPGVQRELANHSVRSCEFPLKAGVWHVVSPADDPRCIDEGKECAVCPRIMH